MFRLLLLRRIHVGVIAKWVKLPAILQVLLNCFDDDVISVLTLTHRQLFCVTDQVRTMGELCRVSIQLARQSLWCFSGTTCRLWHINPNAHIPFFLSSQSTKSCGLLQKMAPRDTLVVAGHFYPVYYEADSSGSPSHKCITVNHNIPRHPVRPRPMTAWHHRFPSKNTAFKKVREGVSSTQHRRLTWNPFTELVDLEYTRVHCFGFVWRAVSIALNLANLGWQIKERRPLKRFRYFLGQGV